jgi:hypothetical protein
MKCYLNNAICNYDTENNKVFYIVLISQVNVLDQFKMRNRIP